MRKIASHFLAIAVLFTAVSAFRCGDPAGSERSVTAAGLDVQLAIQAGGKSVIAFNTRNRLSLQDEKYVVGKLAAASTAANNLFDSLERFPTVDSTNKDALLQLVDQFLGNIDTIIADNQLVALDNKTQAQTLRWIFVARALTQGIRVAIASVSAPTPLGKVLISEADAKTIVGKANKNAVLKRNSKDAVDDYTQLANDIIAISADFYVALKQETGKSTDWLRAQRQSVFASNQSLFTQQLQRI
jgi:hypothetical protein